MLMTLRWLATEFPDLESCGEWETGGAWIEKCYVIDGTKDTARPDHEPPPSVQTDGINFEGAWSFDETVDVNRLTTNDVGSILRTYGVEAARATLLREVSSVFGAYGIGVDQRHLGLIADFMTHQVGVRSYSTSTQDFQADAQHGMLTSCLPTRREATDRATAWA